MNPTSLVTRRTLIAATLVITPVISVAAFSSAAQASVNDEESPAVFTETNAAAGNAIQVFERGADGHLDAAGTFATGGLGTGAGLGSQGAVALSRDGRWLFAVNAGSNDVSVFAVTDDGLRLTDRVASGGTKPISLTAEDSLLYVLNGGGSGNITGFSVDDGHLVPLPDSTRPLSPGAAGPAQVSFNPSGSALVVTEKGTNRIDVYAVGDDGLAGGATVNASHGQTPFGFAFDPRGELLVSEAFGGAANQSALSSYELGPGGKLILVSSSVPDHQSAACWVVVTRDNRFTYSTNTGSNTVSGYHVGHDGQLGLLDANGVTAATGTTPIDASLTPDSELLYVLNSGAGSVSAYHVGGDGTLISLGAFGALPASDVGLAAS